VLHLACSWTAVHPDFSFSCTYSLTGTLSEKCGTSSNLVNIYLGKG